MLASFDDADLDFAWAAAMAMLAEVVKESPYAAGDSDLDAVDAIVAEQATRDAYRGELAGLLASYRALR